MNAHDVQPTANDIYLTTNGYDYRTGPFKKACLFAESYVYLRSEYDNWDRNATRYDHRFHFNPNYANTPKSSLQNIIGCWWQDEFGTYEEIKKAKNITHTFGMVLSKKPDRPSVPCEIGFLRSQFVQACRGRSCKYFGSGWDKSDPNYAGEAYVNGARHSPVKFNDARRLMAGAKFVFCAENAFDSRYSVNYLTEKIFHAFLSRSVPIYIGCWNVDEFVPNLFVDFRKFDRDFKRCLDYCEKMSDSDYQGYLDRIEEFLRGPAQSMTANSRFLELDTKLHAIFH